MGVNSMEKQPLRVLLVDDEASVLEDLRALLAEYPAFQVAGAAGGCRTF